MMLRLCVVMLIFHNRTSAKNPDFRQKSAQNTEKFPQKTLFYIYTILFRFSTTPPTAPPPPQVCQSGLTIRGHSKKWTYDGKNVASVVYVVDNSQICIGRYNRTLTSVDAGGQSGVESAWRGRDETERAPSAGLGIADAIWGEYFYDWVDSKF